MNIKVIFQGQIGVVVGQQEENFIVNSEVSVADCIRLIAASKSSEVAKFLVTSDSAIAPSLFVALDSVHTLDYEQALGERELLLMPPMAGG